MAALVVLAYMLLPHLAYGTDLYSENNFRIVQASEILTKIQLDEPVEYDSVIIEGDLLLHQSEEAKPVETKQIGRERIESIFFTTRVITISFSSPIKIENSIIEGNFDLSGVNFQKLASFRDTQFFGQTNFEGSHFDNLTMFSGCQFNKDVDFTGCEFKSKADFGDCQFNGSAKFESQFSEDAYFSNSNFNGIADFYPAQFNKTLEFYNTNFKNLELDWFSINDHGLFKTDRKGYINLIKNFKNFEDYEAADDCYYHYRNWRLISELIESWLFSRIPTKAFTDFIFFMLCGYGVKPQNTILSSILIIFLFGIFYQRHNIVTRDGKNISYPDAIFFSASIFFTLPPKATWNYAEHWRYLIIFEDILGWILMTLFVVTMGHVILR